MRREGRELVSFWHYEYLCMTVVLVGRCMPDVQDGKRCLNLPGFQKKVDVWHYFLSVPDKACLSIL